MIHVAIADDLQMIRTGFQLIVDNENDMEVVATAADGHQIVDACRRRPVDVVLMDVRMPELDGLAATQQIVQQPDPPRIIILTTFGLDDYVATAIANGADGFLLKDSSASDLVDAIRAVADGHSVLAPSLVRTVFQRARAAPQPAPVHGIDNLTERERAVLQHLAAGRSNAEIGEQLFLSEATIKTHVSHVLAKLGVRDRVQAVIKAFHAGIAQTQPPPRDDHPE